MPASHSLILCATSRLAQSLRWQHNRTHVAAGETRWPTLNTSTVAQWFSARAEEALLRGQAEGALLHRALDAFQEQLLWERVIGDSIPDYAASFFDVPGMAQTAAEAHELIVVWGVAPVAAHGGDDSSDETREFLRWRRKFLDLCSAQGLIDRARWHEAVLGLIDRGLLALPQQVFFAGFDNITPQEQRLQQVLRAQGVQVEEWTFDSGASPALGICPLSDADSECRRVAQWAADNLARNPTVQLGVVVPNLGKARDAIESALDAVLHPALQRPAHIESPRVYNFSLGKPLTQHPLVVVALELIELACGAGSVEQSRIGELLRHPCWSASISEADVRARLEAVLREQHPATSAVSRILTFAQRFGHEDSGRRLPQLLAHLAAIENTRIDWRAKGNSRALPSTWAARFRQLLRAAGWPGERALSSHEFQARQAFFNELDKLAALDGIVADVPAREAQRRLSQLCTAHVFQAETVNQPQVQVVGMLEAGGMQFDALWVMGMTDDVWPPAPRPNPLLPAELQRKAGAPNASAAVQLAFAQSIHQRLLQCAPTITFSFAHMQGATELRPSPLLAPYLARSPLQGGEGWGEGEGSDFAAHKTTPHPTPLPARGERELDGPWALPLDDSLAPPVVEGEHVSGGTGLLKAQAICPAWAYYRYRLGAKKLQTPVEGLDPATRGSIVHEALRVFWAATQTSDALKAMSDTDRNNAIDMAIDAALNDYDHQHRASPLPPVFRKLERERLQRLLGNWLYVELQREQAFAVVSTEERFAVDIEGIQCNLQIDRIDEVCIGDDRRRIVIDYKTGAVNSPRVWAEDRIVDPQLPIYAAIAQADDDTVAVSFARVQLDDSSFLGIAAEDGLLPKVPGIGNRDGRKGFSADVFADWHAVLQHWRSSIAVIAREVKAGVATVQLGDESDLRYCDVLPILRLAERRAQWEAALPEEAK